MQLCYLYDSSYDCKYIGSRDDDDDDNDDDDYDDVVLVLMLMVITWAR